MATLYVAHDGADANPGTEALPFLTIGAANVAAISGDTISVKGDPAGLAVYDETVTFKSGIHYLGSNPRPVLDSSFGKTVGFFSLSGPANCTIENFEIRNYTRAGVEGMSQPGTPSGNAVHNNVVKNCHIHHIKGRVSVANEYSYGCKLTYGNWQVLGCEIHHIHGWNESTGIWFGWCKNHVADGNVVYSVRKEGIRSYMGNLGRIVNNRVFLCWFGLEANEDAQSLWANNYVSHCDGGINPKHTNDPDGSWNVLQHWGLADDDSLLYVRFWHNTIHRCGWAALVHAINTNGDGTGYTHKSDVRNNIFSGKCAAHFWDSPTARHAPNIVDHNVYSTATYGPGSGTAPVYMTGYSSGANTKTLAQLQTDLGFELNGMQIDPELIDPDNGNLDYSNTSPALNAGIDLGSEWGAQMGARGLPAARVAYAPHTMTLVSSSNGWGGGVVDENLLTNNNTTALPLVMVFDFGGVETFNHVFTECVSHMNNWNPKHFTLEGSSDLSGWTLLADEYPFDAGGTGWRMELADPSYRYLRYTGIAPFGGSLFLIDDMRVGQLSAQEVVEPPAETSNTAFDLLSFYA